MLVACRERDCRFSIGVVCTKERTDTLLRNIVLTYLSLGKESSVSFHVIIDSCKGVCTLSKGERLADTMAL